MVLAGYVEWKAWRLNPVFNMRAGRTDGSGEIPDWNTLDVNLSKSFKIRNIGSFTVRLSARNLLDCRYETVSGYPMPGRNFMGGVGFKF